MAGPRDRGARRGGGLLGGVTAVTVGALLSYFFVYAAVFTDAPAGPLHPERLLSYLVTFLAFAFGTGRFAALSRRKPAWWAIWVALPALTMLAWYDHQAPEGMVLHLAYGGLVVVACAVGAAVGRRMGRPRIQPA